MQGVRREEDPRSASLDIWNGLGFGAGMGKLRDCFLSANCLSHEEIIFGLVEDELGGNATMGRVAFLFSTGSATGGRAGKDVVVVLVVVIKEEGEGEEEEAEEEERKNVKQTGNS
jgi:hypothetical protein